MSSAGPSTADQSSVLSADYSKPYVRVYKEVKTNPFSVNLSVVLPDGTQFTKEEFENDLSWELNNSNFKSDRKGEGGLSAHVQNALNIALTNQSCGHLKGQTIYLQDHHGQTFQKQFWDKHSVNGVTVTCTNPGWANDLEWK